MPFCTSRPLRFGDCDPSGIAYFPSYLNILVGVLEEFFGDAGVPWKELIATRRIGTPTVRLDLTFVHPGFHGDTLDFELFVRRVGRSNQSEGESIARPVDGVAVAEFEAGGLCRDFRIWWHSVVET